MHAPLLCRDKVSFASQNRRMSPPRPNVAGAITARTRKGRSVLSLCARCLRVLFFGLLAIEHSSAGVGNRCKRLCHYSTLLSPGPGQALTVILSSASPDLDHWTIYSYLGKFDGPVDRCRSGLTSVEYRCGRPLALSLV